MNYTTLYKQNELDRRPYNTIRGKPNGRGADVRRRRKYLKWRIGRQQ